VVGTLAASARVVGVGVGVDVFVGVAVGSGVAVGVDVAVAVDVAVGGTGEGVGVIVGGSGVEVAVGLTVDVGAGGSGVLVGRAVVSVVDGTFSESSLEVEDTSSGSVCDVSVGAAASITSSAWPGSVSATSDVSPTGRNRRVASHPPKNKAVTANQIKIETRAR